MDSYFEYWHTVGFEGTTRGPDGRSTLIRAGS